MSKEQTLANEEQKLKSANSLNKLYIYIHTLFIPCSLQRDAFCLIVHDTIKY